MNLVLVRSWVWLGFTSIVVLVFAAWLAFVLDVPKENKWSAEVPNLVNGEGHKIVGAAAKG